MNEIILKCPICEEAQSYYPEDVIREHMGAGEYDYWVNCKGCGVNLGNYEMLADIIDEDFYPDPDLLYDAQEEEKIEDLPISISI